MKLNQERLTLQHVQDYHLKNNLYNFAGDSRQLRSQLGVKPTVESENGNFEAGNSWCGAGERTEAGSF